MSSELDSKILEDTNAREYESTKNRLFVIQIFYLFALLAIFLFLVFLNLWLIIKLIILVAIFG